MLLMFSTVNHFETCKAHRVNLTVVLKTDYSQTSHHLTLFSPSPCKSERAVENNRTYEIVAVRLMESERASSCNTDSPMQEEKV